jgi:KipI family sensor histidine kinase inhibitor
VALLGFAPGFPYLLGLDPSLAMPRRTTPRLRVPAGSVAIGGAQAGIYPAELPGGWHLIGRTPLRLFDPAREPPCLLGVGDRVRFVPIEDPSGAGRAAP